MNTTFLATVNGCYLIIFSLFLLFRHTLVKSIMGDILAQRGLFFLMAIITVILGLLMVVSHNVWVNDWSVAVTIFAWAKLIGGVIRLFCPEMVMKGGTAFMNHPFRLKIFSGLLLILGLFLLFHVYHHG